MFTRAIRQFSAAAAPPSSPAAVTPPTPQYSAAKLIGRYTTLPRDLYRIMPRPSIRLRDFEVQKAAGRSSYDLVTKEGLAFPAVGEFFQGPNGATFRPNTFNLQNTVRTFKAPEFNVLKIPEGTVLPPELVALHEHTDHWSIQCTKPMKLEQLNAALTRLSKNKGVTYTKDQFLDQYPYHSALPQ